MTDGGEIPSETSPAVGAATYYCCHCSFRAGAHYIKEENPALCRCSCHIEAERRKTPLLKELGDAILAKHRFLTLRDTEDILMYDPTIGVYTAEAEVVVAAEVRTAMGNDENAKSIAHLINEATTWVRYSNLAARDRFDADPDRLVVANGILNVRTRTLEPFTPDYLARVRLPVAFDPQATCPATEKFYGEIVRAEDVPTLYELAGYPLCRGYPIQQVGILVADGANGKSTYLSQVCAALGPDNVSHVSLQDLNENRFAIAQLYGKLANLSADIPSRKLTSTGRFKEATGGDALYAENKFGQPFNFVNRGKFIFSCNKLPDTDDDSNAYYRRFRIVHFPNTFEGERDDKHLLEKLTTPLELSGLLNKSLEALDALLTRGRFVGDNLTMAEKRTDYRRRANSVYAFVQDRMEPEKGVEIAKKTLYGIYNTYCRDTLHMDPLIDVQFWKGLRHELGEAYDDGRPRGGDGRERVVKGWAVKGLVQVALSEQISLGPMEESA